MPNRTPPIVSIVGLSDSGKTTFLEKLIPELKKLGLKVAAIKHDVHGFDIDHPGKDSWRLGQAGADTYVISGPGKMAMVKEVKTELNVTEIVERYLTDADIVLTEGYKRESFLKIEIYREKLGRPPLCKAEELLAFVSNVRVFEEVPTFDLNDAAGVAKLLTEKLNV